MRRWIVLAGALALIASACGGSDGAAVTTAPATTAPATTAPTTTADPSAYRLGLATIFAGEWTGWWENATYGTTGPIAAAVSVDAGSLSAILSIDLGGAVFGSGDPAPFEVAVDLAAAPPYAAATAVLGELSLVVEVDGAFTLEAPDVPGAGVASFRASGRATSAGITLDYTVGFEEGGEATGTADLVRPTQ
jgi:hypothetical protein